MMYEASLKAKWDYENTIKYAEFQAEAKGKAEGKAEGAHEKAVATARKMKAKGYPYGVIAEFTDLSEEEIEKL